MSVKSVDADNRDMVRGCVIPIDELILSDMLCDFLGLERGTLRIKSADSHGWSRAIEFCVIAPDDDERFPVVRTGEMFPLLYPIIQAERIETEEVVTTRYKFIGFQK